MRLAAILALLILATSIANADISKTQVHIFAPVQAAALAPGLTVSERLSGSCWIGSLASPRSDAWRCSSTTNAADGSNLFDPCYQGIVDAVVCANPFSHHAILLQLTKPLPLQMGNKHPDTERRSVWVRLPDGTGCSFITGATNLIGDLRLNYGCAKGGRYTALYGMPNTSQPLWTIWALPQSSKDLVTVSVPEAWF